MTGWITAAAALQRLHNDPFTRLLLGQATRHGDARMTAKEALWKDLTPICRV